MRVFFPFLPSKSDGGPIGASDNRTAFIALWLSAAWQQRRGATADARLMRCAQDHAEQLRYRELVLHEQHGYTLHRDLEGRMPNARVRAYGYRLPDWYPDDVNMVESVAVQHQGAEVALAQLYASPSHRPHMAGEEDWLREQVAYGVGYAAPAWYVLVTAPKESD